MALVGYCDRRMGRPTKRDRRKIIGFNASG